MAEQTHDELEEELQREQIDRLFLSARILLRQERLSEAEATIKELRKMEPDASEAWELQGDLFRQQGKRKPAQEAYKRAVELDGTNANAERKYAELVLFLSEEDRARQRQRAVVDDPSKHKPQRRSPAVATVSACLFPGFGQLYNRQHEKGLVMLFVAAVILMLMVNVVIISPYQRVASEAQRRQGVSFIEQFELWGDQVRQTPWYTWGLVIFGLLAFLALHIYAIADATIVARREAKEADRLGVEAPT